MKQTSIMRNKLFDSDQRVKKYYGRGGGFIKPIVGTLGENVHRGNVQAGYGVRMADVALSSW